MTEQAARLVEMAERVRELFAARAPTGSETECWLWLGTIHKGYGRFQVDGKNYRAHRVGYELVNGPIPDGLVLDHICRNRACVNPHHLEPVTVRTNTLRGVGPSSVNARRQVCRRGHPFTPENVPAYARRKGWRACKTCHNEANRHRRLAAALRARSTLTKDSGL